MTQSTQPATKPGKIRILIVDDIPETRENLRKLLFFESDIEVVGAATSGEEGITMAAELMPDIVLMDINMPGIDGIAATEAITQQVPSVEVIMMSVQGETDYLRRSMQAGAREFLVKPFSSDDLISSVRQVYALGLTRRQAEPTVATPLPHGMVAQKTGRAQQGKVITVFSPKGGTGCSTLAVNVAVALQQSSEDTKVAVVDSCLQFGDVAVLLNLHATHSIVDLAPHVADMDCDLLDNVMSEHRSGLKTLLAPPRPEMADQVLPDTVEKVLSLLRTVYTHTVVDTSSIVSDVTLAALDAADRIVVIAVPSIPAIKDAKLFFELTEALEYPPTKTILILNKTDPHNNIRPQDIQASIKHPIAAQIPLDEHTASLAANQGVPYVMSARSTKLAQATAVLAQYVASAAEEIEEANQGIPVKVVTGRLPS
ncbi:MAG: response regulator [Ardenticatenia bacterium]|nr:response regulator [Ardenticatenia bacterium]